jgi:hypothetical protein
MKRASAIGEMTFLAILAMVLASLPIAHGFSRASIEYVDAARTAVEQFDLTSLEIQNGNWVASSIYPKAPSKHQKRDFALAEATESIVRDCSNAEFKCATVGFRVFAIPRIPLRLNDSFVTQGARFQVERCFREEDHACQVALISSNCERKAGDLGCKLSTAGGAEDPKDQGPILYFIYNPDFGVTSYGSSQDLTEPEEWKLAKAKQMILQGDFGLLWLKMRRP